MSMQRPSRGRPSNTSFKTLLKNARLHFRYAAVIVVVTVLAVWIVIPSLWSILFSIIAFIGSQLIGVAVVLGGGYLYLKYKFGGRQNSRDSNRWL
jgi:hypothetical protein